MSDYEKWKEIGFAMSMGLEVSAENRKFFFKHFVRFKGEEDGKESAEVSVADCR